MKIKTPTEFIPFKDGVCNIYTEDEDGERVYKYKNIYFNNKTLGFKRAYAAQAVNSDINRVITIPYIGGLDNHCCVEIGNDSYTVDLVQEIYDSNPTSIDLTLKKCGVQL